MIKYLSTGAFLLCFLITMGQPSKQPRTVKQYTNPILAGFYPDPSICRVGNDYYLVNSTFSYFPGIPIFHSKDLVNWKLIGHAITRAGQMDFTGKGVSRSIFAPTIRYHNDLFYITCTMIDGGGNFAVTAKNAAGPWSDPNWLPIDGIDPSLFFDDDGQSYITYNSIPPDNKSLYNGHRTIRINKFDHVKIKIVSDNKILVNGGTDISKKPSWIEGPHIVKKYGYYYLISAEGGTGADHSVVAFRSKHVEGPYVPYENNPILTQRHLTYKRKHPVTSTGHADLVELPDGTWQAIFLGTRPYEADYFNTGRETFLTPVKWINEWPVINYGNEEVQYYYPLPLPRVRQNTSLTKYSGNFTYKENFSKPVLNHDWMFLRTVKDKWYQLNSRNGWLSLNVRPETAAGKMNPSFIARRQQHTNYTVSTSLLFNPESENEKAGLLCFMNENHFYFLCKSKVNNKQVIQLFQSSENASDSNNMILLHSIIISTLDKGSVQFTVTAKGDKYSFYYSTGKKRSTLVKADINGKILSTKVAGGFGANFVGNTIALYATSLGKASKNVANFDWFEYKGNDEIYK